MLHKLSFLLSVFVYITSQEAFDFGTLEIVSDLKPQDCLDQDLNYAKKFTDGLPRCVPLTKSDNGCMSLASTKQTPQMIFRPECTKEGTYASKQCKGDRITGRCFCFSADGTRIFGQQWWKDANDMTCACARRKADMKTWDRAPYFNSLHCDSQGNYEPLQCDVISGQCWCADERTGELTSLVVPDKAMSKLPCYESFKVGSQYLRQCESKKYAQSLILNELKSHGTKDATFGELLCDDDGSFGAYTINDGIPYCTWRDNQYVGSWQGEAPEGDTLNCNCARDSKIFKDAGHEFTKQCEGCGNYQPLQKSGGIVYCVDSDGYTTSDGNKQLKQESDCSAYKSY